MRTGLRRGCGAAAALLIAGSTACGSSASRVDAVQAAANLCAVSGAEVLTTGPVSISALSVCGVAIRRPDSGGYVVDVLDMAKAVGTNVVQAFGTYSGCYGEIDYRRMLETRESDGTLTSVNKRSTWSINQVTERLVVLCS